jgi:hypothetical protein
MSRMDVRLLEVIHSVRLMTLALVTLALIGPSGSWGQANRDSLYLRSPDVLPGVLPEMRNTAYWINRMKQPDERVMTLAEIERMNARFRDKMSHLDALDSTTAQRIRRETSSWPGLVATMPDLNASTPAELSAMVGQEVDKEIQYLRRRPFGDRLGIAYSPGELDATEAELARNAIDPAKERATGVLVETARLRIIPAIRPEYMGLTQSGKSRWDMWNLDILPIGSAVQVLHRSRSGGFLFVLSARGFGWVESENVALGSKATISKFTDATPFMIATGDRVPFYSSSDRKYVSGWLRMGDRLPRGDSDRRISVPVRRTNGELAVEQAWLAPDADVHAGYLPYTRKNVVVQAFKMLDNIYDWTGAWFGRNDTTVMRDIFGTFGFDLPSNGVLLSLFGDKIETLAAGLDRKEKVARFAAHEPFVTIDNSNSGHSQLYVGEQDGQVFVFDTNGYGYPNEKGETLEIRRWEVGTIDLPNYMLRQDLTLTELR